MCQSVYRSLPPQSVTNRTATVSSKRFGTPDLKEHVTLQSDFLSFSDQQAGLQMCLYLQVKGNILCRYGTEMIHSCYLQLRMWSVHTVTGNNVLVYCLLL